MESSHPIDRRRLSLPLRLAMAGIAVALCLVLLVALMLEPNASGRGTHRGLGLPACSFLQVFETPCPSCGMTTAWAHVVRGQWIRATTANVGGTLLAVGSLGLVPWLLASAIRGRCFFGRPTDRLITGLAMAWIAITLLDWGRRVFVP